MSENQERSSKSELLKIEEFDYELPQELIAQAPLAVRESSRLLVVDRTTGQLQHLQFENLPNLLKPGDVLVINDTKVIPARLHALRKSGGTIKVLLLKPETTQPGIWEALVTPIKRLKVGEELTICQENGERFQIKVAGFTTGADGFKRLLVNLGRPESVFALLNSAGYAPLPPYIRRYSTDMDNKTDHQGEDRWSIRRSDLDRYQTVFARAPGAVAAPTAGLHFSEQLLRTLREHGVQVCPITLHVGAGTFKPIESSVEDHQIEPEQFQISPESAALLNSARREGRRIIAVGTTSLRTIETAGAADEFTAESAGATTLYVKPGYQFRAVNGLITNFHLSRSSLLLLVAAFAGREKIMHAYQEAIKLKYRFFSYGDAMFII